MRFYAVLTAAFALLAIGAAPVFAGNHSGPEQLAKGSGSVQFSGAPVYDAIYRDIMSTGGYDIGIFPIADTVATTAITESFSFTAKIGPQTSPTDPTAGAFGSMKLTYTSTTTTTTTLNQTGQIACNDPADYIVVGGCPAEGSTTAPAQTATATADVTCLNVVQNRATIGGHVTKFSGNVAPTRGMLFNATDNTVARQQTAPDQFAGAFVADVPNTCPPPSADAPITSGDIYVQQS